MKHVTLRWDPPNSPLRAAIEGELARRLESIDSPYHETGVWLNLIGSALLLFSLMVVVILVVRSLFVH
jgi:hypothetical protein